MKKSILKSISALFLLTVVLASCNKYEEGSKFTLLTANMRITNTWTSTSYDVTTALGTTSSDEAVYAIKKDGTFIANGTWLGFGLDDSGTWKFNDDKTAILFDTDGDVTTWEILKLKSKELKLTNTQDFLGNDVTTVIDFSGE